jgi:O-antigen ligase
VLGFAFGVVLLLYFSNRMGTIVWLLVVVILLYSATGAASVAEEYLKRGQNADAIGSLSGRLEWWEFGWQEFVKSPWIGMGAYTARFTVLARFGEQGASTVHNTYLEAVLGVGILGLLPFLFAFLCTWASLFRKLTAPFCNPAQRQLAAEAIAVLGILTVRSFFTAGMIVHYDLDFLVIVAYAELIRRIPQTRPVFLRKRLTPSGEYNVLRPATIDSAT